MVRERITITIREDLLNQVDRLKDGVSIRSRSQAFEFLLSKVLGDIRLKDALVLAGGPKKDVMVSGKLKFIESIKGKPLLQHVTDRINSFNPGKIHIFIDNYFEEISSALPEKELDYSVDFVKGDSPKGTIQPLIQLKDVLKDTFLVAYGDTVSSVNLNEMLAFHRKNNALVTLALTTVSNPGEFGVAFLQGNKIEKFEQKPKKQAKSFLVNSGYCLLEPEIFRHISRNDKSLERDLFPKLAEKGLLYGYPFHGLYLNVNSKEDLKKAKILL